MKETKNEDSSTTTFDTSSDPLSSSSSESIPREKRKRGRPKKTEYHPQPQYNPIYNTPIGYQYMPPRTFPITVGYNNSLYRPPMFRQYPEFNPYRIPAGYPGSYIHKIAMPYNFNTKIQKPQPKITKKLVEEPKRKRRSAAINKEFLTTKAEDFDETAESEELDNIEKLLSYNVEDDKYYVKFRDKSYLHCEWLKKQEIMQTRAGVIKIKRFKQKEEPFDPDFLVVDRILYEDHNRDGMFYLVKWKKIPYELSTYESEEDLKDIANFREELESYYGRMKVKYMKMPMGWRPNREFFLKYKESPVFKNGNKLRDYQLEGLNWFLSRWYCKQSCIMADEMGLGKTVQSVTFVNTLFEHYNYNAPALIVSPLSTLIHWEREFKNWTNLRILIFHGSIQGREKIFEYEFFLRRNGNLTKFRLFDVIITTYETVMSGLKHLQEFEYSVGIFDEAHRLKNSNSKAVLATKSLNLEHKILLSGTPLQNNLNELWSLLNFINPFQFSSLQNFLEEFKLEKIEDVERLQNLLRPLMLRRMKEDVEKTIPLKEETIIEVELTMTQKRYYRAIIEKNFEFLKKSGGDVAPNLLNAMMEIRKCCIHPYLIKGAEESIINDYKKRRSSIKSLQNVSNVSTSDLTRNVVGKKNGSKVEKSDDNYQKNSNASVSADLVYKDVTSKDAIKINDTNTNVQLSVDEYYKILIQSSGKLVLLDKLLQKLKGKHKVLIFSQMTKCLDLLSDYLNFRMYKYERIDGGVRGEHRQAAIDRFSTTDVFVFLLCTKAGGVGINLTAADTVIIFDSDWNPQNDLQAQARCHRIGQTSEVKIYRLITRNTYEREMFDKASLKLGLDKAVLQRMSYDNKDHRMKKRDAVEILLKKGAYGVLMENDEASRKFCEEDIDQILEQRTRTIRHQDGGNVFSKASFQVDEEIDDPDFWDNLLSKKAKAENEGRIKRQMRRLAREGSLTSEECMRIDDSISSTMEFLEKQPLVEGGGNINSNESGAKDRSEEETKDKDSNLDTKCLDLKVKTYRKKCLLVFLMILRKGLKSLNTLKFETKWLLYTVYQHCISKINNKKQVEDMILNMESLGKKPKASDISPDTEGASECMDSFDPSDVTLEDGLYDEFGTKMLLRIQVPLILQALLKISEPVLEKSKGWCPEDDKRLINWVINYGYDNYPASAGSEKGFLGGKNTEDLNQRVRKIILSFKQAPEESSKENDPVVISAIMRFGKVTDKNIEKVLGVVGEGRIDQMKELIERIYTRKNRRKKEIENESFIYSRIVSIEKFCKLENIPALKRLQGMPRRWKVEDDQKLQEAVETIGIGEETIKKIGLSEDLILKRINALSDSRNNN